MTKQTGNIAKALLVGILILTFAVLASYPVIRNQLVKAREARYDSPRTFLLCGIGSERTYKSLPMVSIKYRADLGHYEMCFDPEEEEPCNYRYFPRPGEACDEFDGDMWERTK